MPSDIERQLDLIERSSEFAGSLQLRSLLRFLMDAGANSRIPDQYQIATQVLGRREAFDATTDPIVRVEMRRLRSRLAQYYAAHPQDPIVIRVASRGYSAVAEPVNGPPRIVVLPLLCLEDDCIPLAEGLTDDIIYSMRRFPDVVSLARTSVFALHKRSLTATEIAEQLDAQWIVEGSLRSEPPGHAVRIALCSTALSTCTWQGEFRLISLDAPSVSGSIAESIRAAATGKTTTAWRWPAPPAEAYERYANGLHLLNQRRPDAMLQALDLFQQALGADPTFSRARLGLMETVVVRAMHGFEILTDPEFLPDASSVPENADHLTAQALASVVFNADLGRAEELLLRAMQIEPHNVAPFHFYPMFPAMRGDLREAHRLLARALRLDPLCPVLRSRLGIAALLAGNIPQAIAVCEESIAQHPHFSINYLHQAMALGYRGDYMAALRRLDEAERLTAPHPMLLAIRGYVLARSGNREAAVAIAGHLDTLCAERLISPWLLAYIYCGMNDLTRAANMADEALRRKSFMLITYFTSPMLEPLRRWDGFPSLLRRMNWQGEVAQLRL